MGVESDWFEKLSREAEGDHCNGASGASHHPCRTNQSHNHGLSLPATNDTALDPRIGTNPRLSTAADYEQLFAAALVRGAVIRAALAIFDFQLNPHQIGLL
jgi:hypothetical protein